MPKYNVIGSYHSAINLIVEANDEEQARQEGESLLENMSEVELGQYLISGLEQEEVYVLNEVED